ncbi:MAG: translation initiation factor IF-2 [Gemmataceae bacterium]
MGELAVKEESRLAHQEKKRVYALARELNVDTKDLLQYCKELGFEVKNQLSGLEPEQCDQLKQRVERGSSRAAQPAAPAPRPPITTQSLSSLNRVRDLTGSKPRARPDEPAAPEAAPPAPAELEPAALEPLPAPPTPPPDHAEPEPAIVAQETPETPEPPAPPAPRPLEMPRAPMRDLSRGPQMPPRPSTMPPGVRTASTPAPASRPPTPAPPASAPGTPVAQGPPQATPPGAPPRPGEPAGPVRRSSRSIRPPIGNVTAKPYIPISLRRPKPGEPGPNEPKILAPKKRLTDEEMRLITGVDSKKQVERIMSNQPGPAVPAAPTEEAEGEDEDSRKRKAAGTAGGGIPGRTDRHEKRKERAQKRKETVAVVVGQDGRVDMLDDQDGRARRRKAQAHRKIRQAGTMPRVGKVPISSPITVRALSEAIGWKVGKLLFQLYDLGAPKTATINSVIEDELAETVALEAGIELEIRRQADAEERLRVASEKADEEGDLVLRAPIVTIMGHVDHGKTSLLDKIRSTKVVDEEVGGITQVIRAWRVQHEGKPITFLDTPGHEAFTKMRARGAKVTDIAVIVVAATDGVQPQTEEAIAHAKAAGVQMIVAINKIDMPNANIPKTRQQLYSLNVLPDDMGGDTPFVEVSAVTGEGIDKLLETLSVAAELRELRANPNKPASGTCIEAHMEGDEGVFATLLVQQGTLHKGDVMLCGASYGRVRAMYSDSGKPIEEAGPSVPVRITGLDEVPEASDNFHVVPELSIAREIAEKRKVKKIEDAIPKHQTLTLETLAQKKVTELKVILKADFRGSIEAIRKELEKLQHEEVRARILHAGIGAITESDVQLALTAPGETIIVGFNAVPDNLAKALADARGIQIREYAIIYNLTNDIKAAMEGKLKPREEVIHLGRALVRETFRISRVGTIAGCYVTQGVIERSAKIRLIREGVVVYPPADRAVGLDSLKRFKDDVREVREGFDCGIKIAGYDDVKVGDVIEAYRIEHVKRTL